MRLELETYMGFPTTFEVRYTTNEVIPPRILEIIKELQEMVMTGEIPEPLNKSDSK